MATLQEMIAIAGSLDKAASMAASLGPDYALDHQLCLAALGRWGEAAAVNAARPRSTARDMYAAGLFSIIDGDLPRGIFEMHCGRADGLFGTSSMLPGTMLTPDKLADIRGKTVLLRGEGGFGDEIINVRFAKNIAALGAKCVVACRPELASVFARVDGVSAAIAAGAESAVHYDFWLPAMSSPGLLQIGFESLSGAPYLSALPQSAEVFAGILGEKKGRRIGIKWAGNPAFEHEQFRRFPEQLLFDALADEADVWSLDLDNTPPAGINNAAPYINGWDDTLGCLANLDLIITSCTSLAHAAAALGKETWVIVPVMPYYTWAHPISSDKTPWYGAIRLFRQQVFGDWASPFREIKHVLQS